MESILNEIIKWLIPFILNAVGWFEKGVLLESDLAEIQNAINAQYPTEAEAVTEI